jgi:SAM-dependent MidA family methyltransferase
VIGLPLAPLSEDERRHEARVIAAITAELAQAGGWLPFSRFMELALYAPGLGYYAAGAHKLGAGGDFVTAPELSPVFARCLAEQCAQVLGMVGGGEILEFGAGSGALAAELLAALARAGVRPARYRILEPSPALRARQRLRLAACGVPIEWLERAPAAPFDGLVLANEVADALPVERFRIGGGGIETLGVVREGGAFAWRARAAAPAVAAEVRALMHSLAVPPAAGFASEYCPALGAWLGAATAALRRGVALVIDYGTERRHYYAPERNGGTLACHHRQRRHEDPFVNVGLQDLTAWVDFTRLAEAAAGHGLEIAGYTSQANLLLALGFERHLAELRAALPPAQAPFAVRAAARLVLPTEMGERFRCLALARGYPQPLAGFALRDFSAAL